MRRAAYYVQGTAWEPNDGPCREVNARVVADGKQDAADIVTGYLHVATGWTPENPDGWQVRSVRGDRTDQDAPRGVDWVRVEL